MQRANRNTRHNCVIKLKRWHFNIRSEARVSHNVTWECVDVERATIATTEQMKKKTTEMVTTYECPEIHFETKTINYSNSIEP